MLAGYVKHGIAPIGSRSLYEQAMVRLYKALERDTEE